MKNNKKIINLILIFILTILYSCKKNELNNNVLSKNEKDSITIKIATSKDDSLRKSKFKQTSNSNNHGIFYMNGQDVIYNCNKTSQVINKTFININFIEKRKALGAEAIKDFSQYFKKILNKEISNSFYYSSSDLAECSAIFYFENYDGNFSSYLFLFDSNGRFVSKLLLAEINQDIPGLYIEHYSKILRDERKIKVYKIKSMIDEYVNEENFTEIIDSIEIDYILNNNKFILMNKDSVRVNKLTKIN